MAFQPPPPLGANMSSQFGPNDKEQAYAQLMAAFQQVAPQIGADLGSLEQQGPAFGTQQPMGPQQPVGPPAPQAPSTSLAPPSPTPQPLLPSNVVEPIAPPLGGAAMAPTGRDANFPSGPPLQSPPPPPANVVGGGAAGGPLAGVAGMLGPSMLGQTTPGSASAGATPQSLGYGAPLSRQEIEQIEKEEMERRAQATKARAAPGLRPGEGAHPQGLDLNIPPTRPVDPSSPGGQIAAEFGGPAKGPTGPWAQRAAQVQPTPKLIPKTDAQGKTTYATPGVAPELPAGKRYKVPGATQEDIDKDRARRTAKKPSLTTPTQGKPSLPAARNTMSQEAQAFRDITAKSPVRFTHIDTKDNMEGIDANFLSEHFNIGGKGQFGQFSVEFKNWTTSVEKSDDPGIKAMLEKQDGHLSPDNKRDYVLGLVIKDLRELGWPQVGSAFTYDRILQRYANVWQFSGNQPVRNPKQRMQDLKALILGGGLNGLGNQPFNPSAGGNPELDDAIRKEIKKASTPGALSNAWEGAKTVGSYAIAPVNPAAWGRTITGMLGMESESDQMRREKTEPWLTGSLEDDHLTPGAVDRLLKMGGMSKTGEQESPYRTWVREAMKNGDTDISGWLEFFRNRPDGDTHAKNMLREVMSMKRAGLLLGSAKDVGLVSGGATPMVISGLDEKISRALNVLSGQGAPGMRPGSTMEDPFMAETFIDPDTGLRAAGELPKGYHPREFDVWDEETGKGGYLFSIDKDGKRRFKGEPEFDESQAGTTYDEKADTLSTVLTPEAAKRLRPMTKEEDEARKKAEIAEKTKPSAGGKSWQDTIAAQRALGEALWDKNRGPKAVTGEIVETAQGNVREAIETETDANVASLRSKEALLTFAKLMSEGFTMMGDSMTTYAMGVRPGEKPTIVPSAINDALTARGAEKEAALMRLSTFTMSGHLFPKGTSVESMKAQIPLLQHSQSLNQKADQFAKTHDLNTLNSYLSYHEKLLGQELTAIQRDRLSNQWERDFAHKRQMDAYNYSLNYAKANLEQAGNLALDRLELETIEGLKQTIDLGREVLDEKMKFNTGWLVNMWQNLGNYTGWGSPEWHAFKQKVTMQLNIYVNKLTGKQLSKHEVARLKGAVPQMHDADQIFVAKAKTFIAVQEAILARKLKIYAMNGHRVGQFLRDKTLYYRVKGGAERKSSLGAYREMIRRNPSMLGNVTMLTGQQGDPIRPGEDYLGEIIGDYMDAQTGAYIGPDPESILRGSSPLGTPGSLGREEGSYLFNPQRAGIRAAAGTLRDIAI